MPRPQITRLETLLPDLRALCNGLPPGTGLNALRRAYRTLCEKSEAWVEELDAIDLVADTTEYTISTDWSAYIKRIAEIYTRTSTQVTDGDKGTLISGGLYTFVLPDTLVLDDSLSPGEAVTGGLVVSVVLVPKTGADEMPDFLFDRWSAGILGHAAYHMKIVKDVPWSDPAGAAVYLADFNDCLNTAKGDEARKYCTGEGLSA